MFILFIYWHFCVIPYTWSTIWKVMICSFATFISETLLLNSFQYGKAGPVEALINIQIIVMLLLEWVVLGKAPGLLELIGIVLGIVGAITIALGH